MKKTTLYNKLRQLLNESVGEHNRIAKEAGVSQATVSRIHLGKACPTLHIAQPLFDWFEANSRSTRRIANTRGRVKARRAHGSTPAPLGQHTEHGHGDHSSLPNF